MSKVRPEIRSEQEIFSELKELCTSNGFLYVMAYLTTRDDIIPYFESIKGKDLAKLYSNDRLIRTETSTLLGLSAQGELSLEHPIDEEFNSMVERTGSLMCELHNAFLEPINIENIDAGKVGEDSGSVHREAFFYHGETAYHFQYRDIAPLKYKKDSVWIKKNRGYEIEQAHSIVSTICELYQQSIQGVFDAFSENAFDHEKLLDCYTFNVGTIAVSAGLDIEIVRSFVSDFLIKKDSNHDFNAVTDFNLFNARPLIKVGEDKFCLFSLYALTEAVFESPFYWMLADEEYKDQALTHRGEFTESYSKEKLCSVFGDKNVFTNITICKGKEHVCEVDVLVVFANRAIVLQAKSKKLTLESRKGNDKQIKIDFQASIQDSYDQGYECAVCLDSGGYKLIDAVGTEINFSTKLDCIYILSIVLDTYPSLAYQASQFLQYKTTEVIQPPFVLDVCQLDVICEMLYSPLRFLSYLHTRVNYFCNVIAADELVILAYHLRNNLYIDSDVNLVSLDKDISADLDAAMLVRREGVEGNDTPQGILTKFSGEPVAQLIECIESHDNAAVIDLGYLILALNEDTLNLINSHIKILVDKAEKDHANHNFVFGVSGTGVTIHCNNFSESEAQDKIISHCQLRKHAEKSDRWFGLVIAPTLPIKIRFGLKLSQKWEPSEEMDQLIPESWNKETKKNANIPKVKKSKKTTKKTKNKMQKESRRKNRRKK